MALLPDVTHAKGLPEAPNATEGELEALQRTLERMTVRQLKELSRKALSMAKKLEASGVEKA